MKDSQKVYADLCQEHLELSVKIAKLLAFTRNKNTFLQVGLAQQHLLNRQLDVMLSYDGVLLARISDLGDEVENEIY